MKGALTLAICWTGSQLELLSGTPGKKNNMMGSGWGKWRNAWEVDGPEYDTHDQQRSGMVFVNSERTDSGTHPWPTFSGGSWSPI